MSDVRRLTRPEIEKEIKYQVSGALTAPDDCANANYSLGKMTALYWLLGDDWLEAGDKAQARLKEAGVKI